VSLADSNWAAGMGRNTAQSPRPCRAGRVVDGGRSSRSRRTTGGGPRLAARHMSSWPCSDTWHVVERTEAPFTNAVKSQRYKWADLSADSRIDVACATWST
jgi:hypothetical protein